jgi:SnoaL-like domain
MSDHAATIRRFWETTEARDWDGLATVLDPAMEYRMEQTRERVGGRDAFLRFFSEFPGNWHLTVRRVIADADGGVSVLDFVRDGEAMVGISFFRFGDDGAITEVEDVWPEAYEPPDDRAGLTERY